LGNARAIMRIRVTDPGSRNANQNVRRSDLGNWNIRFRERFSELDKSHRSQCSSVAIALPSSFKKSAIYFFSVTRVTVKISLGRTGDLEPTSRQRGIESGVEAPAIFQARTATKLHPLEAPVR